MSIAPLVLPDIQDAPEYHAQAVPDPTDLQLVAGLDGAGWESGCLVTATGPPTFAVAVAAGAVGIGGVVVNVTANPALACLAPSTTDRRDVVLVGADGVPYMKAGVACPVDPQSAHWSVASSMLPPLKPRADANTVVLAEVYVAGGSPPTAINGGAIIDKRTPFRPFQTPVPATVGSPLTTQGGEVLDDGVGNATFPGTVTAEGFAYQTSVGVASLRDPPYNAKPDRRNVATGSMSAGSSVLTVGSNSFLLTDVGKSIGVYGAGAVVGVDLTVMPLVTTIAAWISNTQVALAAPAATNTSAANVTWGTDNTAAFALAKTTAWQTPLGGRISVTPGDYLFANYIDLGGVSSVHVVGDTGQSGRAAAFWFLNPFQSRAFTGTCVVSFNANTTSGSPTITNCVPDLTPADVGRPISGAGIPAGTLIDQVGSPGTQATLKKSIDGTPQNATATATGVALGLGSPWNVYSSDGAFTAADATSTIRLPAAGYFAPPFPSMTFTADVAAATSGAFAALNGSPRYTFDAGAGTITSINNEAMPPVDGVTLQVGQRFLFKNGGTPTVNSFPENGIYVVTSVGSVGSHWVCTRTGDPLVQGLATTCLGGQYNRCKLFFLTATAGQWSSAQGFVSNVKAVVSANVLTLHNAPTITIAAQGGCELGTNQMRFTGVNSPGNGLHFEGVRFIVDPVIADSFRGAVFSGYLGGSSAAWGPVTFEHCVWGLAPGPSSYARFIIAIDLSSSIGGRIDLCNFQGGRHGTNVRSNVNSVSRCTFGALLGAAVLNGGQTMSIRDSYVEPYTNENPDPLVDWDQVQGGNASLTIDNVWVGDLASTVWTQDVPTVRYAGTDLSITNSLLAGGDYAVAMAGSGLARLYMRNTSSRGGTSGVRFMVARIGQAFPVQYAELVACSLSTTQLVTPQNCNEIVSRGNNGLPDFGGGQPLVVAGAVSDASFPFGYVPPDGSTGLDTTNHRWYYRRSSAWHYVAETA